MPYVGQGQPLATQLRQSIELRDVLIGIFTELNPENRLRAFSAIVENLDDDNPNPTLVTFLENCSRNENPGRIELVAARRLTDIRPSAQLADVFLTFLENRNEEQREKKVQPGSQLGVVISDWWSFEADAWLGLAALGHRAAGSVDRIAKLINNVPAGQAKPQTIYLMASPSGVKTRFEIHRQLLPIEILAMIGPGAKPTVPEINKVLKTLTGAAPTPQGDYGFDGFHEKLVLERIVGQDARTGLPSPKALPADVEQIRDLPQRLDSALVAIRRITGLAARFDMGQINANGPSGRTGVMGGGYPGEGSAGMMSGYGGAGEYGEEAPEQHIPRLVTYKGKSFAEWVDTRNVARSALSLGELRDIFMGTSLLAKTPQERTSAAEIAISAYEYAIRHTWELTPELREFLVDTVEASHSLDPDALMTPIEDTLAQVTPARQSFLLAELLVPVEESEFGFRLHERPFSREVVVNPQFPNAYNDLVENWDKHPSVLQEAILQVEAHLPALGRKNSVSLLTRLVKEAYDATTSDAKTAGAMTDLQMKAAFILAATSPKDPTLQGQLEKLLAGVLARPHVVRRNVNEGTGKAPQLEEELKAPAIRNLDADQLHAAVALKLACGGALTEATARQFAKLIIQDMERQEIGSFEIISPSDETSPSAVGSGMAMMYGGGEMNGYAPVAGSGYPGGLSSPVGSGFPGGSAAPGGSEYSGGGFAPNPTPVDYPGASSAGAMGGTALGDRHIQYKNKTFSAEFGDFSRRSLVTHLLLTLPPADPAIRNEIGEQLVTELLKAYPESFSPMPPTPTNNISVYDLIQHEFREGVRYHTHPVGKGTLEMARFLNDASSLAWTYLPEDRRIQIIKSQAVKLQAVPVMTAPPQKLYDGRPFEEWLKVVSTERSPERLVEAVQALTILGKDGRDAEAATAILNCLAPFSPNSRLQKTPEGRLIDTIQDRFWQLDRPTLTPILVDSILRGNSNQRQFILVLNESRLKSMLMPDGLLLTPQFVSVLVEATNDADPDVRRAATAFLTPLLLGNAVSLPAAKLASVTTRLTELLGDQEANLAAGVCLSQLAPKAGQNVLM